MVSAFTPVSEFVLTVMKAEKERQQTMQVCQRWIQIQVMIRKKSDQECCCISFWRRRYELQSLWRLSVNSRHMLMMHSLFRLLLYIQLSIVQLHDIPVIDRILGMCLSAAREMYNLSCFSVWI